MEAPDRRTEPSSIAVPREGADASGIEPGHTAETGSHHASIASRIQRGCQDVVSSFAFEQLVLVLIVFNCTVLALFDPADTECISDRCKALEVRMFLSHALLTSALLSHHVVAHHNRAALRSCWKVYAPHGPCPSPIDPCLPVRSARSLSQARSQPRWCCALQRRVSALIFRRDGTDLMPSSSHLGTL